MHQHLEIAYLFHMVLRCCIVIAQWVPYIRKYRHLAIWISQKKKHQGKPKITHNNPWDMFKTAKNIFWLQRKIGGSPQDLSVNCNLTSPQWNYIKYDYAYLPYIYHVKTKLVLSENCMFPIPMDCHVLETTLYLQCDRYTSISNTSQSNLLTGSMGLDDVGHQRASTNLRRLRRPFCLGNVQVGLGQVWGRFSQPLFKF